MGVAVDRRASRPFAPDRESYGSRRRFSMKVPERGPEMPHRTLNWTRPSDLVRQVRRLWDRGAILASLVTEEPLFPRRLVLKRPSAAELRDRFDEARTWSASLRSMRHVRVTMREFRHRVSGANALPHEAWVDSVEEAVALIGKQREAAVFRALAEEASVPASRHSSRGSRDGHSKCSSSQTTGITCSMSSAGSRRIRGPASICARWTCRGCTASSWKPAAACSENCSISPCRRLQSLRARPA